WNAEWYSKTRSIEALGGKSWADDFHVWRMDWTLEYIALYVDDELMIKEPMSKLHNKDGSGFNPFKQPHYILLNLAMGGMKRDELIVAIITNYYKVDYVRVYHHPKYIFYSRFISDTRKVSSQTRL